MKKSTEKSFTESETSVKSEPRIPENASSESKSSDSETKPSDAEIKPSIPESKFTSGNNDNNSIIVDSEARTTNNFEVTSNDAKTDQIQASNDSSDPYPTDIESFVDSSGDNHSKTRKSVQKLESRNQVKKYLQHYEHRDKR